MRKHLLVGLLVLATLVLIGTVASASTDILPNHTAVFKVEDHTCVAVGNQFGWTEVECFCPCGGCDEPNGDTPDVTPVPDPTPEPTPEDGKEACNRGIGNNSEGCDPGNSSGQGGGEGRDAGEDRNENKKDK